MENELTKDECNIIKIKIQQKRNKKVTVIENIPKEQRKTILDSLKKQMACGGSQSDDGSIQLQGDKTHAGIIESLKKHIIDCKIELNGKIH